MTLKGILFCFVEVNRSNSYKNCPTPFRMNLKQNDGRTLWAGQLLELSKTFIFKRIFRWKEMERKKRFEPLLREEGGGDASPPYHHTNTRRTRQTTTREAAPAFPDSEIEVIVVIIV